MSEKLDAIVLRYDELLQEMQSEEVAKDGALLQKKMKESGELEPIVLAYRALKSALSRKEEAAALLESETDDEMIELLKEELRSSKTEAETLEEELKLLLLPKDPNEDRNVILEIRSGVGGEEAALFASDVLRMYERYSELMKWKTELLEVSESDAGGISRASLLVSGRGAYSHLKYESGTHRVQRIPKTESQGRIHTSAVTVAAMIEADEVDVKIDPKDVRIDVFRASGNGGQCVNTTDSAVRLTHLPTGIVISCQDEKSQLKNRDKAMKVLRSRLYDLMLKKQHDEESAVRKSIVGSGDRSEKIRTYNFPQSRVTDHRVNFSVYGIEDVMNGGLQPIIEKLMTEERSAKLAGETV